MQEIYEPNEDSFLFSKFLLKLELKEETKFLDMGCGSCIIADSAKSLGIKDITCIDINPTAVKIAKGKGYKAIHSDLFEKIKEKYDIICFNAPYLPEDSREPKASKKITTGGKNGDEISIKFITQAKKHLNKNGKIYLLISNLTPMNQIKKFKPKIVEKKKIFFEELSILELN